VGLYRIVPLLMYYQGPVYYNYHRAAICESYVLLSWFSVQISLGLCSFPIHVFRIITLLPSLLNQSARQVICSSDALLDATQFDELWGQTTEPHLSHLNYKSRTDLRLSLSRVTSGVSIAEWRQRSRSLHYLLHSLLQGALSQIPVRPSKSLLSFS